MPDGKRQQSLLDSPDLDWGKAQERQQSFDPTTGAGAEAYARRQSRQSLAQKVKTTGQQGAEDLNEFGKEMYGPLYEPGQTIQRNASLWALPYQGAGLASLPLKQAIAAGAGGVAGSMGGAYAGGHGGHYLGGIPGRLAGDPVLEKRGAGIGEATGATLGGISGGMVGGMAGYRGGGIPLKVRIAGLPLEATMGGEAGGVGRVGSAGDLASWTPEDLWEGYMKNRGTPQAESLAREIQRRGIASSPAGTYRPPTSSGGGEWEDPMEQARRGAPGVNPQVKSVQRHFRRQP